ncbi:nitrogen regulation protein NR(II) [Pseudomaricurvus sp. HS19]|uniref:nitrogen regulation protein NR(II) n=1 Tax=Pseudomaricurvus sp. HS19 TaxID=2692626 RepID=UPI00136D107F|nr:nitrogen regulation protein NR(II) [Pseudomaricurvus sp. HS19]MYM64120.1 nitrogen regulation protein NR(II) [Pseudomaricurvus sp. HS19]
MTSDLHYKAIFDHLNVAVLVVDNQLLIQYMNPAAEMLLAVSRVKVLSSQLMDHFHESGPSLQTLRNAIVEATPYTKRRASWILHNGQALTVDYTVTPLPDESITIIEVASLDRLLRISREEALLAAQETTRNLVRSLAHEIKNPLGGIRGAAQLLARELPNAELEEFTQIIIEEVDRLRNLVDRMLGPRQVPKFASVNVHEVLERVAAVIKVECGSDLRIRRDYDPSIPDVAGDKELLIQALLNIARNAMQALQESDLNTQASITLRTRIQRQFTIGGQFHNLVCRIDIEDNGPGIPKHLLADIFYPMITGRAEGTGLGLAISQNLINQHHGLIECESHPGQTTFSIYLPLEQHHVTESHPA